MERDLPKSMERDLPNSMERDLPNSMERDLPNSMERAAKTHLLFMVRLQRRSMIKYMVQRWGADW